MNLCPMKKMDISARQEGQADWWAEFGVCDEDKCQWWIHRDHDSGGGICAMKALPLALQGIAESTA